MFFNKSKKAEISDPAAEETTATVDQQEEVVESDANNDSETAEVTDVMAEAGSAYAFYKPDPYPKELVSVLKGMLQRLFPDTKRAYLLEAQKSDQKGYLLIVDIDSQFLKMINIYLDGETKRVRGDIPIECVLYSKSGSLTEGIDPFYFKENAQSKANNLASKEFSSEVVFSQMPEFEIPANSDTSQAFAKKPQVANNTENSALPEENNSAEGTEPADSVNKASGEKEELSKDRKPVIIPVTPKEKPSEKTTAKVKPATKKELFGILNEYGTKKTGEVSAVAVAAIKEYEFYIPYSLGKEKASTKVDTSLPIDEKLRFKKLINPDTEISAVPLFTEKDDALMFAKRCKCKTVCLKYKDFASSRAAELTGFDGVLINPDGEEIFLSLSHPLLG